MKHPAPECRTEPDGIVHHGWSCDEAMSLADLIAAQHAVRHPIVPGTVYGKSTRVSVEMKDTYPELAERVEEMLRTAFRHDFRFEPTTVHWAFEAAYHEAWEAPDGTMIEYDVPDQWLLLVEGMAPGSRPPDDVL